MSFRQYISTSSNYQIFREFAVLMITKMDNARWAAWDDWVLSRGLRGRVLLCPLLLCSPAAPCHLTAVTSPSTSSSLSVCHDWHNWQTVHQVVLNSPVLKYRAPPRVKRKIRHPFAPRPLIIMHGRDQAFLFSGILLQSVLNHCYTYQLILQLYLLRTVRLWTSQLQNTHRVHR
jgi:hypothetical protein